jgi:hypothetical protein
MIHSKSGEVIMSELKDGCVKPAKGPMLPEEEFPKEGTAQRDEGRPKMVARVGSEAIDFEANAFLRGEGFKPIKLSDYRGKWIILCFYPGDFTFV